jgi:hypothetical protein
MTADLIENTSGSTAVFHAGDTAVSVGTTYTSSLSVKFLDNPTATFSVYFGSGASAGGILGTFAVNAGVVTSVNSNAVVTNGGNGFYRLSATYTTAVTGGNQVFNLPTVLLFLIANRQLEAGASASTYIPTTSSQVTRAADIAVMQGTNFSDWYNQTEGTFFVEYSRNQNTNVSVLLEAKAGSALTSDRVGMLTTSLADPRFQINIGGVGRLDTLSTYPALAPNTVIKGAMSYLSGNNAATANGAPVVSSASTFTPSSYDNLQIGQTNNAIYGPVANSHLFGHIRRIAYWSTPLTIAEQQQLTQP